MNQTCEVWDGGIGGFSLGKGVWVRGGLEEEAWRKFEGALEWAASGPLSRIHLCHLLITLVSMFRGQAELSQERRNQGTSLIDLYNFIMSISILS